MRLLIAALLLVQPTAAFADTATVELGVNLLGLPVGSARYTVTVDGDSYRIEGTGRTGGVGRLASSASSKFSAEGRIADGRVRPASHALSYRDGDKRGSASITFAKGRVASASETPPPKPRKDRVPVTPDMLRGTIDPTSALILAAPHDAKLAELCSRTLRVSDARNVFELTLSPDRSGKLKGRRTHTCRARYRPLGGHRASSEAVKRVAKNRSLRITYAPLADGVWGVVGFQVRTRVGTARGVASKIG